MAKAKNKTETPSPEQIAALLEQLQEATAEIERLKEDSANPVGLKRHRWGALQITGIRNGFVGFYRDEWELILAQSDRITEKLAELDSNAEDGPDVSDAILNKDESYTVYADQREASKKK